MVFKYMEIVKIQIRIEYEKYERDEHGKEK